MRVIAVVLGRWIKQAMQVDDHIFHLCVVDRALRGAAPGFFGRSEIRKDADKIDGIKIFEIQGAGVLNAATHDKMHFAHASCLGSIRAKINPAASVQS